MDSKIFNEFRWLIFIALGMCLSSSPALAEEINHTHSRNSLINTELLSAEKSMASFSEESPSSDYFSADSFFIEDDFFSENSEFNEELQFAQNRRKASSRNERLRKDDQRGKVKLNGDYLKGIFTDANYAFTSPLRWDGSDWATASFVAGMTGVFFVLDDEIKNEFQDNRNSTTDDISEIFEHFGNGAYSFTTLAGLYLYGKFGENEKMERTALLAAESFLVTGLFTTVLKVSTGRLRPSRGESADTFDGPSTSNKSFPSGHTSTIFAIATVFANEYEDVPLVTPLSYGIATLAGLSRINDNQHWASDVFFGAALGYFTSKTILRLHSNKKGRHFTIYPRAGYKSGGLVLATRF